jgi:diacylglycerol kinase family enzyme
MDVLAIFNPSASRVDDRVETSVMRALRGACTVEAVRTDHPFHAAELATRAAQEGARLVVAVGGDGTANEAANGLAGSDTALWCLPGGSTNVFARTQGVAPRLGPAVDQLAASVADPQLRRMTTGTVDGRHFLFMSGIGVTAEMMRRVARRPELRARLRAGYVAVGAAVALTEAGRGRLPRLTVEAGGDTTEAATVIIQRSDPLTFFGPRPVSICPPGALGNGTLSIAYADGAAPRDVAGIFLRLLSGDPERVTGHPRVTTLQDLEGLRVSSPDGRRFGIEVDGTYIGDADSATYGVATDSLLVASPLNPERT